MAGEDIPAKLKKRYKANGADLANITLLEGQRLYTRTGVAESNVTLLDIDLIHAAVHKSENVKLLIVDPVGDFIPGVNSDKDNEVRALLNPLAQIAKEREIAVLLICHRKKNSADRADNVALGSVAFTAKARAVHHVIIDPNDDAHPSLRRRLLLPGKLNDQAQATGLAYRIKAPDGVIEWDESPVTLTADAAMRLAASKTKSDRASDPQALSDTENWLKDALESGPRLARDLVTEGRAEGLTARMLRRAREKLGVLHHRNGFQGGCVWELAQESAQQANTDKSSSHSPALPPVPSNAPEFSVKSPKTLQQFYDQ
jgi:putative DNA primase/helicase